jgi:adenylate kinase
MFLFVLAGRVTSILRDSSRGEAMHKYVIMGVQGCGKGTQARLLGDSFDLVHISVGDIFRWHIQNHTKLGAQVKRIVAAGSLVSDDLVGRIVRRRLDEHDWNYGFILDGFPRSASQAEFFLESYDVDAVIHIRVPDETVRQRVLSRRLCSNCGLDYNLISHRPKVPNICDVCGGQLVSRPDDTSEALSDRLHDYHSKTEPVLDLFRRKELVLDIDGTLPLDQVQQEIRSQLRV